jgi:2-polyprenyl-3-methyl-5-hydroxy-6-metoxy-1,4-benzoquinol methylase
MNINNVKRKYGDNVKYLEIENINALTPFDHGVWEGEISDGDKIIVGDKALFRSRSQWLVDKIVTYLTNEFSLTTLRTMSVLEVGSYDGWVLTQICKHIDFLEVIGVEPRKKNIKKGEVGRKLAGIDTQAKFVQGRADEVDSLFPNHDFDIVICLGMLHHVSSTYDTLLSISAKSSNICIIDSMIIPPLSEDIKYIEPYVNTKDVIYHGEDSLWAVAAYKYESPYGDGSRPNYGVVNIPSAALIEMSLRSCGFSKSEKLGDESDFYDDSGQILRGVKELLCASKREVLVSELDQKWQKKVENIEEVFCNVSLPVEIIVSLIKNFNQLNNRIIDCDFEKFFGKLCTTNIDESIKMIIDRGLMEDDKESLRNNVININDKHFQILSVIFRMPYEKILLEVGKFFIYKECPDIAIKHLQIIVRKPGCDWWSFYRSCYLLSKALHRLERHDESNRYKDLLYLSNENFPL